MLRFRISEHRVRKLGDTFHRCGTRTIEAFEKLDVQYRVARSISLKCGKLSALVMAINGTVTYMLPLRGEDYWKTFETFTIERCRFGRENYYELLDLVEEFTRRYNKRLLNSKLNRLSRIKACLPSLLRVLEGDLEGYWRALSLCLHTDRNSKTIVFSVKMAYYGLKSAGLRVDLPRCLSIPVDRRVALLSISSGAIDTGGCMDIECVQSAADQLVRTPKIVREVWRRISNLSSIPPLGLDIPLWMLGKYFPLWSKRRILATALSEGLGDIGEELKLLINELYFLSPP